MESNHNFQSNTVRNHALRQRFPFRFGSRPLLRAEYPPPPSDYPPERTETAVHTETHKRERPRVDRSEGGTVGARFGVDGAGADGASRRPAVRRVGAGAAGGAHRALPRTAGGLQPVLSVAAQRLPPHLQGPLPPTPTSTTATTAATATTTATTAATAAVPPSIPAAADGIGSVQRFGSVRGTSVFFMVQSDPIEKKVQKKRHRSESENFAGRCPFI